MNEHLVESFIPLALDRAVCVERGVPEKAVVHDGMQSGDQG